MNPPDLLVLCPPCTDEGGWFHLNSTKWDRLVYAQRVARSRSFIRFCAKLFRIQTDAGRQAILEHPTGAKTWKYPEIVSLCQDVFHGQMPHVSIGSQVAGKSPFHQKFESRRNEVSSTYLSWEARCTSPLS